ncbi:hypothetical protein [Alicyclobacillus sp. SO9]|uniref:hypothetical protein n=1 Tax=Alicyclobacillus sp. SO9 TaxID=2665646 RepID=UPI00351C2BFF
MATSPLLEGKVGILPTDSLSATIALILVGTECSHRTITMNALERCGGAVGWFVFTW